MSIKGDLKVYFLITGGDNMEFLTSNVTFTLHMLFVITLVMNITLESLGFEVNIFKITTVLLLVICFFALLLVEHQLSSGVYWFYLLIEIYIFLGNIYYFVQYQKK